MIVLVTEDYARTPYSLTVRLSMLWAQQVVHIFEYLYAVGFVTGPRFGLFSASIHRFHDM